MRKRCFVHRNLEETSEENFGKETIMTLLLAESWWSLVLRGFLAVILGVVAFAIPGITIGALVIVFGAYALTDGIVAIIGAYRASKAHERWGILLAEGLAGIAAAGVTIMWPGITALTLVLLIGAWAFVTGIFEIVAAIKLRKYISGEWLLLLSGIASVVFGLLVVILPLVGAIAIALCIGIYAVIFGVIMISLGLRLRMLANTENAGASIPLHAR
jgi:uncharacterized membrane protein HdeD (DUF308 family)